ncbi:MAG: hypothetical protein ABIH72_04505 [archaeon]
MKKLSILVIILFIAVIVVLLVIVYSNYPVILNARNLLQQSSVDISAVNQVKIPSSNGYWCEGISCLYFCQHQLEINTKVCSEWCADNASLCSELKSQAEDLNITLNLQIP